MVAGFSFQLTANAEDEYLSSYLWYEEQQTGLGERFGSLVRGKLNTIVLNPEIYSIKKGL